MHILIPILLLAVIGLLVFYGVYFTRTATITRWLKATAPTNIGVVRSSEKVKIVGVAQPVEELLIAPLSGRPCCHYHILVEQKVYSGKYLKWETIIDEESSIRYVIENQNRYACINSKHVQSLIVKDRNYELNNLSKPSEKLEDFLHKHGYEREKWSGFNVRYSEGIIERGGRIAIYGRAEWRSAESLDLPLHYDKILCLKPDEQKKHVFLSDDKTVL